jgi:hypothetical protein
MVLSYVYLDSGLTKPLSNLAADLTSGNLLLIAGIFYYNMTSISNNSTQAYEYTLLKTTLDNALDKVLGVYSVKSTYSTTTPIKAFYYSYQASINAAPLFPINLLLSNNLYLVNQNSTSLNPEAFAGKFTSSPPTQAYNTTTKIFSFTSYNALNNQDTNGVNSSNDLGQLYVKLGWINISAAGVISASGSYSNLVPAIVPAAPQYTKLYLGHYATITDNIVDLGSSNLKSVAAPIDPNDATNKNFVDTSISSKSTSDRSYADTIVNVQKSRIDTILDGSTTDLNQFQEIVSYINSLDATQAQTIITSNATITSNLNGEITRATTVEASLKKKSEYQIDILPIPAIYADGDQPIIMPSSIKINPLFTGTDGFYYKNASTGKKINWYLPNVISLVGSDILNINFDATLFSTSSAPYISIYTQKTGINDLGTWYHSRVNYGVSDISLLSTFKDYQFYTLNPVDTPLPNKTQFQLTFDQTFSKGVLSPTDKILAIAISTDSNALPNAAEFVLDKIRVVTVNGTFSYNFSSTSTEIISEASLARSNETTITNNLNSEISRASTAESSLSTRITTLSDKLDALYNYFVNGNQSTSLTR